MTDKSTVSTLAQSRRARLLLLGVAAILVMLAVAVAAIAWASDQNSLNMLLATLTLGVIALVGLRLAVSGIVESERANNATKKLDRTLKALVSDVRRIDQMTASIQREMKAGHQKSEQLWLEYRTTRNALDARLGEAENQLSESNDAIASLRHRINESTQRLTGWIDATSTANSKLASRLDTDRSNWSLAFARRDTSGSLPSRVLLLVTIHRTASTRLFDIARTHPDAFVEPVGVMWEELGLEGRRYPSAMSDLPGAGQPIEVEPGVGASIRFVHADGFTVLPGLEGHVAVEKVHPQFFGFDSTEFVSRLTAFESRHGTRFDLVYLVRNPRDVMWSMAEYKSRQPNWYRDLPEKDIPDFTLRSFEALKEMAGLRSGLILDYKDIRPEAELMIRLGSVISGVSPDDRTVDWLKSAFAATAIDQIGHTSFVGDRDPERSSDGPDSVWQEKQAVIGQVEQLYESILDLQPSQDDSSESP